MEHINRKPDQTRGIYWLIDEGASYEDIGRGKASKHNQIEINLPLTRAQMERGAGELFSASHLLPLAEVGKEWVLAGWCSRQEFDTPTGELGPGQYNITGARATYGNCVTWNEDGRMVTDGVDNVDIIRNPQDTSVVDQVRRKEGRT